jgi:RHS repeat-associated protein
MQTDLAYAPYGEYYAVSGPSDVSFTGQPQDLTNNATTGLYDFMAREYAQSQGRWIQPDPAGASAVNPNDPQSWNRCAYVRNNPLEMFDPLGLDTCPTGPGGMTAPTLPGASCDPPMVEGLWQTSGELATAENGYDQMVLACSYPSTCVTFDYLRVATYNWNGLTFNGFGDPVEIYVESLMDDPAGDSADASDSLFETQNGSQVSLTCQAKLLGMMNNTFGTNFTDANVSGTYNNGAAANLIIDASGLTPAQFNAIQPGRYTTYAGQWFLAFGLAGHVANEAGVNPAAVFSNSNVGGVLSVHFAFHDDSAYANNPWGALMHWYIDVLHHNTRNPC